MRHHPRLSQLRALAITSSAVCFIAITMAVATSANAQPASKLAELEKTVAEFQGRVAKVEASGETNTLAIAQISTRLAELAQRLEAIASAHDTRPELVERVDAATLKTAALERDVETLRTQLADLEQPYAAPAGGGASGFTLESGDFSATFAGQLQVRWELTVPEDFATITTSSFQLRRTRIGLSGNGGRIFNKQLKYKFLAEFLGTPSLRDYYIDLALRPSINVRLGQDKIHHTRSFLVSSSDLLFMERSSANDRYRYDRDVGLWVHGTMLSNRLGYYAGVSNGAGRNRRNDNIDFALSARVRGAALGELIDYTEGDYDQTAAPALSFGASVVHDLVRLPDLVGSVVVMERDVDSDEVVDNVRVFSLAADATFRLKGLEIGLEGYYRRESWGTILDHSSNEELRDLIRADSNGNKNYVGATGQASYFVVPKRVSVGARAGYSSQTFFPVGGQSGSNALADRLFEFGVASQLYSNGKRLLGIDYTLTNFNSSFSDDPGFDIEHRFILETQLIF